ncbi:MAG: glutamate-1-semialdehyde 2,1-aminomutase, partial [Gammaproteobacteria bacterium]
MSSNVSEFERAQRVLVGGVNSAVRAFRAVGGTPRFMARGKGPYLYDVDGREYVDLVFSWGPMIAGHSQPDVVEAVVRAAHDGLSFGAPNVMETELAERICAIFPQVERVRFTSSGTEAAMSALRLARGFTGRDAILKFDGCYHGHADSFLVSAGSGVATLGLPNSPGVPEALARLTLVAPFNDLEAVERLARAHPLACIIVEPIAGNMNFVRASVPFMKRCRELCSQHGALLVFDEVMTGFRVALGGAQSVYAAAIPGFRPDLTVLGKVIGGGMPLAAFGGPR